MPNSEIGQGRPYAPFYDGPTLLEDLQTELDKAFDDRLQAAKLHRIFNDPTEQAIVDACNELAQVLISKRRDYGPGNIPRHGEFGVAVRADDKLSRITNLLKTNKPNNEAIEDSWQDLAGYAIIGRLVRQGKW